MGHYLVVGGAGGVGDVVVQVLAHAGHEVAATVLNEAEASKVLEAAPAPIKTASLDLGRMETIHPVLTDLLAEWPGLDGVINCAAIAPTGPAETTTLATFRAVFDINCLANIAIAQSVLPRLRESRGRLVLVSSMAGRVALPFMSAYSMSKHGLEGFADSLRVETMDQGVSVILIEPGTIRTGMVEGQKRANQERLANLSADEELLYGKFYRGFQTAVSQADQGAGVSPEEVAAIILSALTAERPSPRYVVGADAEQLIAMNASLGESERDATLAQFMSA